MTELFTAATSDTSFVINIFPEISVAEISAFSVLLLCICMFNLSFAGRG